MISSAAFGASDGRVRRLRFVPRASVPLAAACAVAAGVEATLRELLGATCELVLGEPAALGASAWADLARDALLYLARGRATDVVLLVPRADARRLVRSAFGEDDAGAGGPCSALEAHALTRIAVRCAASFEPLAAARTASPLPVAASEVPTCAAYFDLRVHAPIALTLGIGIVRDLPEPTAGETLRPALLDAVELEAQAVFAEGKVNAADFMRLRPGDVVKMETKVGAPASLKCGERRLAMGVPGVVASRTAFLVGDVAAGAHG